MTSVVIKGPKNAEELKALSSAVFDVASQSHGHLEEAKKLLPDVPKQALYALLPAVRSAMYLETLLKYDFNPYHEKLLSPEPASAVWLQWRLLQFQMFRKI